MSFYVIQFILCHSIYRKDHIGLRRFKAHCDRYDWPNKHLAISVIVWKMLGICWQFPLQNYLSCTGVTGMYIPPIVIQWGNQTTIAPPSFPSFSPTHTYRSKHALMYMCVTSTMDTFSLVDFLKRNTLKTLFKLSPVYLYMHHFCSRYESFYRIVTSQKMYCDSHCVMEITLTFWRYLE